MTCRVPVTRTAAGLSITLPPEIVDSMGLKDGDSLYVVETDAGVLLTPLDPELQESLAAFEALNARYSRVLRELAE